MIPDQQLPDAAKAMAEAAAKGRSVRAVLERLCPYVYRQILQDREYPGLLGLWGRSVNVDENAGQVIVLPAILHVIGELAGVTMNGQFIHAGLQHTYGYLFSLIDTPFGAKRDRWLSTNLACGFGFDHSLLGVQPQEGTLLANLTWFLGHIVFSNRPNELARLQQNIRAPAPALLHYDYARLQVCRIVEQVVLEEKTRREVLLITDLVPFPQPPVDPQGESTLLVYSVQDGAKSPIQLITAFPVRPDMVGALRASVPAQGEVEVRLRYNAYLPGCYGKTLLGRRFYADASVSP